MLDVSPLVFQPVLGITRVKLVSNWLVTLNHCTQEKRQHEATHVEQLMINQDRVSGEVLMMFGQQFCLE